MNKYIVANFKMNMTALEIAEYLKGIDDLDDRQVIICPSNIYIPYFLKKNFKVGIQNIFFHSEGAYTGEISPKQAISMGIRYTLIGHSERRIYFDESDLDINKKLLEALKYNMRVILCIGETNEEKNMLKTDRVLKKQLTYALRNVDSSLYHNIMVAYEPVWAIGSGIVPSNKEIETTIEYIKELLSNIYNWNDALVLYGGSVNEKNIKELCKITNMDGVLVGGASTDYKKFLKIIEIARNE